MLYVSNIPVKKKNLWFFISLAKLGKGENLTTAVLLKIAVTLNCNIDEIMEIVPDTPRKEDVPIQQ